MGLLDRALGILPSKARLDSLEERVTSTSLRLDSFVGAAGHADARAQAASGGRTSGLGWINALTGMGTGTDKSSHTLYGSVAQIMEAEATAIYRGDGLGARVIDLPVRESLRQGYDLFFEGDDDADIEGWEAGLSIDREDQRGLGTALRRLLTWREIYGGSALYLICADGRPSWQPLDELSPRLVGVRALSRWDLLPPLTWNPDPLAPPDTNTYGLRGGSERLHPSRLIVLGRGDLPRSAPTDTDGWMDSLYVRLYNALSSNGTLDSAAVGVVNNFVMPVQKMAGLRESIANGGQRFLERMGLQQLVRSMYRITLLDENESFAYQTTSIAGLPELMDRFPQRVCAITGIPLTLLMGMSPAGLNATGASDIRFFYDNVVSKYQTDILYDVLRRIYTLALRSPQGPTQGREPDKFRLEFRPLYAETPLEMAQRLLVDAQRDNVYIAAGVLTPEEVAVARFADDRGDVELMTPRTAPAPAPPALPSPAPPAPSPPEDPAPTPTPA